MANRQGGGRGRGQGQQGRGRQVPQGQPGQGVQDPQGQGEEQCAEVRRLDNVGMFLPGPGKKCRVKVELTDHELIIDIVERNGITPGLATFMWQQHVAIPSNATPRAADQPVTLRLLPGQIDVMAVADDSVTLLFATRNDDLCSTVVLYNRSEGTLRTFVAFALTLVRWNFRNTDQLEDYSPKECIPAYQWLMAQASDQVHNLPVEVNIRYDTNVRYFYYKLNLDKVKVNQATRYHVRYELKKAFAIVAHRLLHRLRLIHNQNDARRQQAIASNAPIPVPQGDMTALARDFDTFRGHLEEYGNMHLPQDKLNWDDPVVDNGQSECHRQTEWLLQVDQQNGNVYLDEERAATRVDFHRHLPPDEELQSIDYEHDPPRMRLYQSTLNRWSVVLRIEFKPANLIIMHQDRRHLKIKYRDIGYFRCSGVGQSVYSLSIHPLIKWGFTYLEADDPFEIELLQSLLRWRMYKTGLGPEFFSYAQATRPLIGILFSDDARRNESPNYGFILRDERSNCYPEPGRHTDTSFDRTMWLIDMNFSAFIGRLMHKLAIELVGRIYPDRGRNLMTVKTFAHWRIYWRYRDVVIPNLKHSPQCTLPHIVPRSAFYPNQYRMPFEWQYGLFDAPDEY